MVLPSADATSALEVWSLETYTQTDRGAHVTASTPGTIRSGADLSLDATDSIVNDQSKILAGGVLHVTAARVDNRSIAATVDVLQQGTAYAWQHHDFGCGDKNCTYSYEAYTPNAFNRTVPKAIQINTSVALQNQRVERLSAPSVSATAPVEQAIRPTGPSNSATPVGIHTGAPNVGLPTSGLFKLNTSAPKPGQPSAPLIETDARFTNRQAWLSSDYITAQVAIDPAVTQKRLGDGFYEQKLLREQVAQLTGRRFLGNYSSDQQEYQVLMDSGLTFAKAFNLRQGVALTAAQMAQLTTDIVWLQQDTITLPDGSVTQALVPHVYAAVRAGDLAPSGALLSGNSVDIHTSGDLTNNGTILGRKLVQINANTLNNQGGQIGGNDVALTALQDINNVGGSIGAQNSLTALAGRDINLTSTTQGSAGSSGAYSYSQSGVDRVASLYVRGPGLLLANAGNNLNLTAAQLSVGGDVQLHADNSVNLATVQKGQSNNFAAGDANNHTLSGQTSEVGSTLAAGGGLNITADQDINSRAAELSAQGVLSLAAKGNILLDAGQTQSHFDEAMTRSSSDLLSTTTTRTQTQSSSASAQVSRLSGKSVSVIADQHLVSVGSVFKGTDGLYVEGKDTTALYSATDTAQSSTSTQTSSSFLGISLENKTSTDSKAQSSAIATRLVSTQKAEIGIGNKAELQGTEIDAPQIVFTKTDPSKAGVLILGTSTDTTQTSHTEKNETLGLYQEAKGSGSKVETLNQTTLKGNVTFDAGLKITAQVPKDVQATAGGQALAAQVQTLQNTLGSNSTGLAYLNQLASNPNVQWDKVALANEHWSYDQAGLTPAGAALLSIAVAAYTGGMGAELLGGTAATATTVATSATLAGSTMLGAAANAGFASLASQAAVAMVNNGGDISKTLQQLGSEQSIKGLLTTMVTAGALQGLDKALGFTDSASTVTGQSGAGSLTNSTSGIASSQAANQFAQNLLKNVTNNVAGAAIDSAINGNPLDEKALSTALSSALVTAGMAVGANAIGDAATPQNGSPAQISAFTQQVAHAVLGCVGGVAIAGNSSGCSAGAVGAVVGEMTAEYAKSSGLSPDQSAQLGKILSAAAGVLVGGGGDNAAAVNIANSTGANAIDNNFMQHLAKFKANIDACKGNPNAVGCGDFAAMTNGTPKAMPKVSGYEVAATVGADGKAASYTVGTGPNALVMQPADYAVFVQMPADQQAKVLTQYTQVQLDAQAIKNAGLTWSDQASNARLMVSCPSGDCSRTQQAVQGVAGASAAVADTLVQGVKTVVDIAGKSSAVQVDTELGTNQAKEYQPVSAIGQSVQNVGVGQTVSNAVGAISQIPSNIEKAAANGDAFNAAYQTMSGALIVDGAVNAVKAGTAVVSDMNAASKAAAADAASRTTTVIESNSNRDANMTTGLRPADSVNKAFEEKGYTAPFTSGTFVDVQVSTPGQAANMVVNEGQAAALIKDKPALGQFATPDEVLNQGVARGPLAITPNMKEDVSNVVPVTTTGRPMVIIKGKVAPQVPATLYPGDGNQIYYDYPAGANRLDYVIPTGPAIPLPPAPPQ